MSLKEEIEAEVAEYQLRRAVARMDGGTALIGGFGEAYEGRAPRNSSSNRRAIAERVARLDAEREGIRVVKREPCFKCGVRADLHAESGCRRYVAAE